MLGNTCESKHMSRTDIHVAISLEQLTSEPSRELCILCPIIGRYPPELRNLGTWLSPLAAHSANDALLQALAGAHGLDPRVYAGVFAADPLRTDASLIQQLKSAGVRGVINYPSVSFIDGKASATLDQLGLGIDREIRFLVACSQAGLRIAGVAGSAAAARRLLEAGADFLVVHGGAPTHAAPDPDQALLEEVRKLRRAKHIPVVSMSQIVPFAAWQVPQEKPAATDKHQPRKTTLPKRGRFLLGAAIGTGMAARAAERGGADFLLALNAGRFRSMGTPSAACMLALRDPNRMVMDFGSSEILPCTSVPVFFGAGSFGTENLSSLVDSIAAAGFHGVVNFPSRLFLDGRYRQFLEECGMGFEREIALLKQARARGLLTLAYVSTVEEARLAAQAGVDIVNIEFGWNMGGSVGVNSALKVQDAAADAAELIRAVRAIDRQARCVIEGGPIVTPEQVEEVCNTAGADGYIGGSTIDRVPLEGAIEMTTSAFKTIGSLRRQVDTLEQQLHRRVVADALIGFSEGIAQARERVAQAMQSTAPMLIVGEPGTGRGEVAKAVHEARARQGRWLVLAECKPDAGDDMELSLFGCAAGAVPGISAARTGLLETARRSTLLLTDAGHLNKQVQQQLLHAARNVNFWPRGATEVLPLDVRFIGITRFDPALDTAEARFDPAFAHWLGTLRIDLPALRDRLEDLPMLAERILRASSGSQKARIEPAAYRTLLSHLWPGNLRELRAVLQKSLLTARGGMISERDVVAALTHDGAPPRKSFTSERDWILDGLRRNRFRRGKAAHYLGISRKTLYNKMVAYKLLRPEVVARPGQAE
jgi:predicted TIM-barrel enzyme/DNA-binding NtrC family response regulator